MITSRRETSRASCGALHARRPIRRIGLALSAVACVTLAMLAAADDAVDEREQQIDRARTTLEKWVDVRRTISKERAEWTLRRETLNDRVALVEGEIATLRERIAEVTARADETEGGRAELERESANLKQAAQQLADAVAMLEARTRTLLSRGPDPIREKVELLSQRMPLAGVETKLSLGERYQNVIGILNEVNRFNGEITARNELRQLPDGTSAEVSTIYIGLGHGYFVTTAGTVAGIGSAGPEAWTWSAADEARGGLSTVMSILRNEQPASFVRLPVRLDPAP